MKKSVLRRRQKLTSLRRLAVRFTRKADSIENQLGLNSRTRIHRIRRMGIGSL